MWNEKISITFPFLIITNIINCDLLVDGDETLKAEELLLTKIVDEDDELIKVFNQQVARSNLQNPLIFQMQPNVQLMQMYRTPVNLGSSPPNLMYSNPAYNVMPIPNFPMNPVDNQQILVNLPVDIFSKTYKDPYENHNHLLRDNTLDELLIKQIMRDFSNYNYMHPSHQQTLPGISLPYAPPNNFGGLDNFPPSINSANYVNPNLPTGYRFQSGGFYPSFGQQSTVPHLNDPLQFYPRQQEYLYGQQVNAFNPLNAATMEHLYKGTTRGPPDIEIIKSIRYALPEQISSYQRFLDASGSTTSQRMYANTEPKGTTHGPSAIEIIKSIGYALPEQVSFYHPEKFQRFLDASGNSTSQRIYAGAEAKGATDGSSNLEIIKTIGYALPEQVSSYFTEKFERAPDGSGIIPSQQMYAEPKSTKVKHMYDNWTESNNKNNNMQLQYQADNSNEHRIMEAIKARISSQYYHSNRKPITFDNYYARHPESLEVIQGKIKKSSSTNTDMKHSNLMSSQRATLRRRPNKMEDIDDNVAEDTNINIEVKMKTNTKDQVNKM